MAVQAQEVMPIISPGVVLMILGTSAKVWDGAPPGPPQVMQAATITLFQAGGHGSQ